MTFEEFCKFSYSPCMITQLDGARIVRENVLFHSFFFFNCESHRNHCKEPLEISNVYEFETYILPPIDVETEVVKFQNLWMPARSARNPFRAVLKKKSF